jgi:hypothetical protein
MAVLNLSMAFRNPGPSLRFGASALRIASPIVSVETAADGGDAPLDGGVGNAATAGLGDWTRDAAGLSRSSESERVPKMCRWVGGM